jgi:hypothetical protein
MLVFLERWEKKREECVAIATETSLRVYEGPSCSLKTRKELATHEAAMAELERFVARREKLGYQVRHRLESPWIGWVDSLESLWMRVVNNARELNVPCDMKQSYFQRTFPACGDGLAGILGAELADLARVAKTIRLQWVLGDEDLMYRIEFEVAYRRLADSTRLWTRRDNYQQTYYGDVVNGAVENHMEDETERLEPAAFAEWFPRHVRDDVMTFTLADLSR